MQIIFVYTLAFLVITLLLVLAPFYVLQIAEKRTYAFRIKFEKGEIPLDSNELPFLLRLYGNYIESKKNIAILNFAGLIYIYFISYIILGILGADISYMYSIIFLFLIAISLHIIFKRPDETRGLGISWMKGIKKLKEMGKR